MNRRLREIGISGVFVLCAGYAIWPPGNVYWNGIAQWTGLAVTVAIVMVLCSVLGAALVVVTGVSLSNFTVGGGVSYAIGTVAVERIVPPFDASEYAALYGLLLVCFVFGAAVVTTRYGRAVADRVPAAR